MFSILIWVAYLIVHSIGQQCSFPNERCICMTTSPLCRCPYITTDSTLNFTVSYKSHLILQSSLGCLPCPPSCLECTSLSNCTSCQDQFILINGSCVGCSTNCKKCKLVNMTTSGSTITSLQCSECIAGYYVDSKSQCQLCPLEGSLQCTSDTLISCVSSYWLDNNGATCIKCDVNCRQCSSTTKCSVCYDGYYLSAYRCWKCLSQCYSCTNSTACSKCLSTGSYFNTTTITCMSCPNGCLECTNSTYCLSCGDQNNSQYTLNSNGTCSMTSPSLQFPHCAQNKLMGSVLKCVKCQQGYFQQVGQSQCHYGCSVLCRECQGAHYGLCSACEQNTVMFNRHCIPRNNINSGTAYQLYLTAMHHYNSPTYFTGPLPILITRLTNSCLRQSIMASSAASSLTIKLNNLQSYRLQLSWKVYLLNSSGNRYQVTFNNSNNTIFYDFNCTNSMYEAGCTTVCIAKTKLNLVDVDILDQNTLSFSAANSSIGLSQLLVTAYRCGGVQGYECLQCSQINVCTKCVNPSYFLLAETCIQECPPTYYVHYESRKCYKVCPLGTFSAQTYSNSKLCQSCPSQCVTCQSNQTCFSCSDGYYLYQSSQQCISQCPYRYFPNQYLRKCEKCPFPCLACRSNRQCSSCIYGFYDNSTSTCAITCPIGYYGDLETRVCEPCQSPCATCQLTSQTCVTCLDGFVEFYRQCYKDCPQGYYLTANSLKLQCSPCDITCSTCLNQTYCTRCVAGYLLNNSCQTSCPLGYYANILTQQCSPCPTNCLSCSNLTHCSLCQPPMQLDNRVFSCVQKCPSLQYPQPYSLSAAQSFNSSIYFTCKPCVAPCYECLNYSYCLSCVSSFLQAGFCVQACLEGTFAYEANLTCLPCPNNCAFCQSQHVCTSCAVAFILFQNACIQQCPLFYYFDSTLKTCMKCSLDCIWCNSSTYCLNCTVGLFKWSSGKCLKTCPSGTYANPNSWTCTDCSQHCSQCLFNSTTNSESCSQCESPYFLTHQQKCQLECSISQYGLNGICLECSKPCLACSSQSQCISCLPGYGYALIGECLADCPLGYFGKLDSSSGYLCDKCPTSCIECWSDGGSTPKCSQCKQQYYLHKSTGECLTRTECMTVNTQYYPQLSSSLTIALQANNISLFYASTASRTCQECSATCIRCINQSHYCTSCRTGYFLHNYQCLPGCPTGFYPSSTNNTCLTCNQNTNPHCIKCINEAICLQCSNDYYLYTYSPQLSLCLKVCPVGYYGYAGKCSKCKYPCLECSSGTNCSKCAAAYIQLSTPTQQICLLQCPSAYYKSANSTKFECLPCPANCLECTQNQCSVCDNTTVLIDNKCVQNCPTGMYKFFGTCLSCMYGCSNCNDSYTCNVCMIGFLFQGNCIKECPYGLIPTTTNNIPTCIACQQSCLTCKIEPQICTSCHAPLYLYLQSCIPTCLAGTYPQQELHQCATCTKPCQTCSNSHSCQTCIYGYILYAEESRNQCVKGPLCPNSYYLDVLDNYCKIGCDAHQYSQPISRTCSDHCPEGFTAYQPNMTCLYQCPHSNMYIDSNSTCQQNKSSLGQSFITANLPYFSCNSTTFKGLLQIICYFTLPMTGLDTIDQTHILVEDMEVLAYVSNDSQILQIFAQPNAQFNGNKFVKKWLKVGLRPRYKLHRQVTVSSSRRSLEQASLPYPLQNSDYSFYLPLFNFYSEQQRQTSQYLSQLASGISIGALIIWAFSFIKNKKSISLVWITGLHWLYLLSTVSGSNYPPNVLNFISGFKTSMLIFATDGSQGVSLGNRLWVSSSLRLELITPTQLTNFMTLSVPILGLIGGFVVLCGLMLIVRAIVGWLGARYKSQHEEKSEHQVAVSKQSNLSKSKKSIQSNLNKSKSSKSHKQQKNPYQSLSKKISILIQRFKSNYLHHLFLLISQPCSILLSTQLLAPEPAGLIIALILTAGLVASWAFNIRQLCSNKFPLFKQQGYKYYVLHSVEGFILGVICIIGNTMHFMGVSVVLFVFNLYVYCAIFHRHEWKLIFWGILDVTKIAIIGSLIGCIQIAEVKDRDALFFIGWCPVVLIMLLVIMLAMCAARDFFQEQSIAFKQLIAISSQHKRSKKQSSKPLLQIPDQQLKANNTDQSPESSSSRVEYESQQSFFEDEQEYSHTDSEDQDFESISSNQGKQNGAPKMLIKHKKQN